MDFGPLVLVITIGNAGTLTGWSRYGNFVSILGARTGRHPRAEEKLEMRFFSKLLLCSGLFLFAVQVNIARAANDGRISGSVKTISGNPLGDAVVKIFREMQQGETLYVSRTDRRGFFQSTNLQPGMYQLHVSRRGYQPAKMTRVHIDPGRTTSLNIVLHEFWGYISKDDDPRNQDLKTVLHGTSDRRLIFRNLPGDTAANANGEDEPSFRRSGSMSLASSAGINGESYLVRPHTSQNGIATNFAFAQPVSRHSRMILSGQVDYGYNSYWRIRNTYNYRPDSAHDYRISVGYGRMSVNNSNIESISPQFPFQESSIQSLAFGLEGTTEFFDLMAINYGFDYSRLQYGNARNFIYPSLQILITPADGWCVKTSFTSRRMSDINSVYLPDGELINLSEPTLITMIGDRVSMSQVRHSEISAQKIVSPGTTVEVAIYQDRARGPGLPLMVTTITPSGRKSHLMEIGEDHSRQQGLRVHVSRRIVDFLNGSLAYVYGTSTSIADAAGIESSDDLSETLLYHLRQRYHHSITSQLDATIPFTKTTLLATMRWYPENPLTPVDWFSDRMDIGTKSINFEIRQIIPVPEFMGTTGRWEALVDLRNLLNQGAEVLPAQDGEVVLNRNPRSLRFGLNLNFH